MAWVVDYSFARPEPAAIRAAGYAGAVRYLSGGGSKDLTAGERDRLHAAGLSVGLVWETTASRAGQGAAAGRLDAGKANAQADALGWPSDRPLFFAVDFQARWGQVAPYFFAARASSARPVGVYGCYDVIECAADAGFGFLWQCAAWSGNGQGSGGTSQGRRLSAHAVLFQRVGYVLGDTCDVNDVLADDWGGWHPSHAIPQPSKEDDMAAPARILRTSDGTPWLLRDYAGTRKNLATLDGATGQKRVDTLKLTGTPDEGQVPSPDADWMILDLFAEQK